MGLKKTAEDREREAEKRAREQGGDAEVGDIRSTSLRIAAEYRNQILSGDIKPGERLPTTGEMCEAFSASTTAVQNAMRALKDEGLVVGQKGLAIRARSHRMRTMQPAAYFAPTEPGQPYRWIAEAQRQGMTAESELLDVDEVVPPSSVAEALSLGEGGTALLRRQLLKLNGEPAELVENYYPMEIARGTAITERRKVKGGVPTLLAEMGFPFRRAEDVVSARTPTAEQGKRLKLPSGELPVLRTFRTVYSAEDRVIEVTIMAKAGHLYELKYEVTAG